MAKRKPTRARPTQGSLTTRSTDSKQSNQCQHPQIAGKNPAGLAKLRARILGDDSTVQDPVAANQVLTLEETAQNEERSKEALPGEGAPVVEVPESQEEGQPEMSSRNRPRNGTLKDESDAHEETNMWNQIKRDIEKLSQIQKRQREVIAKILEMEEQMAKRMSFLAVIVVDYVLQSLIDAHSEDAIRLALCMQFADSPCDLKLPE